MLICIRLVSHEQLMNSICLFGGSIGSSMLAIFSPKDPLAATAILSITLFLFRATYCGYHVNILDVGGK